MTTIKRKPRIYKKGKKIYIKIKGKFVQIKKKQVPKDLEAERPIKKVEQILFDQLKDQQQQYIVNFVKRKGRAPRVQKQDVVKQAPKVQQDNYEFLEGPNAKRKPFFNEKDKKNFFIAEISRLEQLKADQFKQFQNQQDQKQISEQQQNLKGEIQKIDNQLLQNQIQFQQIADQINQKISNSPQYQMHFPKYESVQRADPFLRSEQHYSLEKKQVENIQNYQEVQRLGDDISKFTEQLKYLSAEKRNQIIQQIDGFVEQFRMGEIKYDQVLDIVLQIVNHEVGPNFQEGDNESSQPSIGQIRDYDELVPFEIQGSQSLNGNGAINSNEGLSNLDFDQIFMKNAFYYGCYTLTDLGNIIQKVDPDTQYQIFVINPYEDKTLEKRPGHWIVLIINNICCEICLYDCLANPIDEKIKNLINKIMEKLETFHYYKFKHNLYRRQSLISDTCGFYVINFILSYLRDNDFQKASLLDLNIKQSEQYIDQFKHLRFQDL